MKKYILISALLCGATAFAATPTTKAPTIADVKEEILQTPTKTGGVLFAYPFTTDSLPTPPLGYEPFYLSHYGRHGSRYLTSYGNCEKVEKSLKFEKKLDNLTPEGEKVYKLIRKFNKQLKGHEGELTLLGGEQHKGIAKRMQHRFPSLFKAGDTIISKSSISPRCIISMSNFCEGLKEEVPQLIIQKNASPEDMKFIMYHTPMADALEGRKTAEFKRYEPICDSLQLSMATAAKIYKDPSQVKNLHKIMRYLHDIASDMQDLDFGPDMEAEFSLLGLFTPQDLFDQWQQKNYSMYLKHGMSPGTNYEGPMSAKSLLRNIVDEADRGLKSGSKVNLRFGHDTALLRLAALMGIEGTDLVSTDINEINTKWHVEKITPMAANLQIIFFKNRRDDILVTVRLNEQPVRLTGLSHYPNHRYYYPWSAVRDLWLQKATPLPGQPYPD